METWRKELYLKHHGIKGQKWGVRNGPPYPLNAQTRSVSEKRAGLRKSLDKPAGSPYSKRAKSGISKAIKIGAIAAVTALAIYGAYNVGHLDTVKAQGRSAVRSAIHEIGSKPLGNDAAGPRPLAGNAGGSYRPSGAGPARKRAPIIRDPKTGFKRVTETVEESLKNANPLRGSDTGSNNCTHCAIAGILRTMGQDVTAKSTGGKMRNLGGVVEDCFKNAKVYSGSAIKFSKSPEDAAEMLKKRFGDNAAGVVGIGWKNGYGHAFSWVIKNGAVRFLDFQNNMDDDRVRSIVWPMIDSTGDLTFARLDDLELNLETIDNYVDGRLNQHAL